MASGSVLAVDEVARARLIALSWLMPHRLGQRQRVKGCDARGQLGAGCSSTSHSCENLFHKSTVQR